MLHAENSVKKYGGRIDDYLPIHDFLDSTKSSLGDVRHRAILHNAFGVFICEKVFGHYIEVYNDADRDPNTHNLQMNPIKVSVRDIAEDHIVEDVGYIPSIQDWLKDLPITDWMLGRAQGTAKRASDKVKAEALDNCWSSEASLEPKSDSTEDFLEQIAKYEELKKKMSNSAKEVLIKAAANFFLKVPQAKAISWIQYTPYFNDGDACVFNVHEAFVLTEEEMNDGITYEDDTSFYSASRIATYKEYAEKYENGTYWKELYEKSKGALENWTSESAEAWEQFSKIFNSMDNDFMLDAFDDHVQVWLKSDGSVVTEEYSHD